jgi:excisionase family DNA binding protein
MTTTHTDTSADSPPCDLDWLRNTNAAALTRNQTAQILGVDSRTVTRAIESGELPSLQMGRRVLIPRLPLLRLLGVED